MEAIVFRIREKGEDKDWLDLGPHLQSIEHRTTTDYVEQFTIGVSVATPIPVGSSSEISLRGCFLEPFDTLGVSLFSKMHRYSHEFEWISCGISISGNAYVREDQFSFATPGILLWELELYVFDVRRKFLVEQNILEPVTPKIGRYGRRIQEREGDR